MKFLTGSPAGCMSISGLWMFPGGS